MSVLKKTLSNLLVFHRQKGFFQLYNPIWRFANIIIECSKLACRVIDDTFVAKIDRVAHSAWKSCQQVFLKTLSQCAPSIDSSKRLYRLHSSNATRRALVNEFASAGRDMHPDQIEQSIWSKSLVDRCILVVQGQRSQIYDPGSCQQECASPARCEEVRFPCNL